VIVEVRFYAELNDFLCPRRRGRSFEVEVGPGTTVKDLVESRGVPHVEIDVILVNGTSVDFTHRLQHGDRVAVYPVFEALDIRPILRLRPAPLRHPSFVLDVHLGKLARLLRLFGFDALWQREADAAALVASSVNEGRTLLSRDRQVLRRGALTRAYYVRETEPRRQVVEVLRRFDLFDAVTPFGRCLECNGLLEPVEKAQVEDLLPPRTRREHDEFHRCEGCGHLYWKGSHYDRLLSLVDEVLAWRHPASEGGHRARPTALGPIGNRHSR
jgi:uncharacterized protein